MSFFDEIHQNEYIIDGVHSNDAGFIGMTDSIGTVIRHSLEKNC